MPAKPDKPTSEEKSPSARKRAGRVTKAGKGTPAKHEPGAAVPPSTPPAPPVGTVSGFDPAPVAEAHGLYRHNRKDGAYYLRGPDGEFLALSWREAKQLLRGVVRGKPQEGEIESEADRLQTHIILHRRVDYVLDGLAGYRPGLVNYEGVSVLVTKPPRLIEPAEGEWPLVENMLAELLPDTGDGVKQWLLFCGWLKYGIEAVRAGEPRAGQILILAGKANDGKSRLQHFIITPALGGRHADPGPFLLNDTAFNSECFSAEHLLMEDVASSQKKEDRQKLKQKLKQLAVNDSQRYHEKGRPAVTLSPLWRCSLSLNDGPDDLSILPAPSADFAEKTLMLRTSRPSCLPGASEAERRTFRETIRAEMPAFIYWLLNHFEGLLPAELRGDRFGVRSYENPSIREAMEEETPHFQLLEMLDAAQPWLKSEKGFWIGKASALRAVLEDDGDTSDDFGRWQKHNNLVRCLGRLRQDRPGRVSYVHHGDGGKWKVWPPEKLANATPDTSADAL